MQDRYAGDVGDFVKLGLLRTLGAGKKLGVAWYRFPDESHNKDGRHLSYLEHPQLYRNLDPELFDHLEKLRRSEFRSINSLLPVLPNAISSDESVDPINALPRERRDKRLAWFARLLQDLSACDLVFADPDNGIIDDQDWRKGRKKFGKQIPLSEVKKLAEERCAIIYHHNTRRTGGHDAEVDYWIEQIGAQTLAIRATAYSPRTFFIINADSKTSERCAEFCHRWKDLRVYLHGQK